MNYNRKRSEATEQECVINWARHNEYRCPDLKLLHHIPNGGSRNRAEAVHLKAQGVKAGVPDLCLPVPRGEKHGLYIEMKWKNNKPTEKQKWWLKELYRLGYEVAVCWTADAAILTIKQYLELEDHGG